MLVAMPEGLGRGIPPTTRGRCGPGCWGRMRWRITRYTGIGRRPRVFWSRWGEAFIRRDWGTSARSLGAMRRFQRRGVLRKRGVWRKSFGPGSFWLGRQGNRKRRKRPNTESTEEERGVHRGYWAGPPEGGRYKCGDGVCQVSVESRGGFVEFDEDFAGVGGGDQEEIYAGAVGTGAGLRINRRHIEFGFQNLRGAIHVFAEIFNLLDAFAEFLQKFRDGAAARGVLAG